MYIVRLHDRTIRSSSFSGIEMWILLLILILLVMIIIILTMRPTAPVGLRVAGPAQRVDTGIAYQRYFNGDPGLAGDMAADANWSEIRTRNDLELFRNMNSKVLRLYEWNYTVPHNLFISDITASGLMFQLPISNYVMGFQSGPYDVPNFYNAVLNEITDGNRYKESVHSIAVSNEPYLSFGEQAFSYIDRAINDILAVEAARGITGNLPPITVPSTFANINNEGPGIYEARRLNELPSVQRLGDRFVHSINTTNPADSIKNEFADVYQKPFAITEWGLSPQNYPEGQYAAALQSETEKILEYARTGAIPLRALFGFLYFKQVWKEGSELNFGFTCFPDHPNLQNCLQTQTCPPRGAQLGLYAEDNSLLALARAYGGTLSGVNFGQCPPLRVIR